MYQNVYAPPNTFRTSEIGPNSPSIRGVTGAPMDQAGMPQQQQWGTGYSNAPSRYYNSGLPPPSPTTDPNGFAPAYQRTNALSLPAPINTQNLNNTSSTGLIRLTLRKPMGIVFEPMTDPHNPSQQRGVRICDLPRTGAAAMSQKLEVGDELLSINDKTMSRLTFDEIMDFIIEADAERVDLLFRRPIKEKVVEKKNDPLSPLGSGVLGSNSNSVKWIDEDANNVPRMKEDRRESERERRESSGRRAKDDPSIDDTYTVESQSQYTMDTYDDKYSIDDRDTRNQRGEENYRGGKRRNLKDHAGKERIRKQDPIESSSFLDMLIDTLCTSVIGRDAGTMCSDRTGRNTKKDDLKKSHHHSEQKEVYNEDDEFTVDDGTYATYEEVNCNEKKDAGSVVTEEEGTTFTENDGAHTITKNDEESFTPDKPIRGVEQARNHPSEKSEVNMTGSKPKPKTKEGKEEHSKEIRKKDMSQTNKLDLRNSYGIPVSDSVLKPQRHAQPRVDDVGEESMVASAALPLKELEYDHRIDYAADVSVMESLGGPSLLIERARHEYATSSGAGRASAQLDDDIDNIDPEFEKLVAIHGDGFPSDPGMTKEETAYKNPDKFYEHAVCALLQKNEPEKVRLLSKLMAKYKGREQHLINKLSARYCKESQDRSNDQEDREKGVDNLTKHSMSGMEKIHEGGEDEEASSAINDPSRANIAAIESTKKRIASEASKNVKLENKVQDDGWPPAMSDPWGTQDLTKKPEGKATTSDPDHGDSSSRDRQMDDEGSYSEGSSYSGDSVDGTSPAIIAQVSELLNYVYGKTSVAGQIDRVSTIMRAYEGREAVLLELLETKALIKANADSNRDSTDLPISLRNSPSLNKVGDGNDTSNNSEVPSTSSGRRSTAPPETPVSVLSDPTMAKSPQSNDYPAKIASPDSSTPTKYKEVSSPSDQTFQSTSTKKKKKGLFSGFFGGKRNKGKGNFPSSESIKSNPSVVKLKSSKKAQSLDQVDDSSI